jgi:tetratricopeptide (TPR) repeat protein
MTSAPSLSNARLNHLASIRMKSGIALLEQGDARALQDAVRCFEEAIELRRRLPLAENPGFRYGLAAGWINRGDALARLAGPENVSDAVNSYTAAIELLRDVPANDDGLFVRRLAIAWMNRGLALEEQEHEEAVRSYREAIKLLAACLGKPAGRLELVLASVWINLGNALLRSPAGALAAEAREAAEQALSLAGECESNDQAAAEAGFKARHILCQAMTILLGKTGLSVADKMDLIGRMTDAVESALELVQTWEKAGVAGFAPLAARFFHFGALVYEKHQPHFLADYILEHLEPERGKWVSPERATWLPAAMEALSRTRCGLRNLDFALISTPQGIRRLEILKEVQAAEEFLQRLQDSKAQAARTGGFRHCV